MSIIIQNYHTHILQSATDFADLSKMSQDRSFDSGMYIVTVINLLYHECPVIFKDTDLNLLRQNLCYNVLLGQFV
jgi:hypothetical protein